MESKIKARDAVAAIAQTMCKLSDDEKRRAEAVALLCVLEPIKDRSAEHKCKVMHLMGSSEAFHEAMKQMDDLRRKLESGEVL